MGPGMMISKAVTVIVRRQSPDWSNTNDAFWLQLAEFERFMGRPPGGIRDLIELWNRTFSESFFNIRNKMKIMTDANLNRVSKAKIIDLDRYRANIRAGSESRHEIYAFTDDDDWFSPELACIGSAINEDCDGIVWRSAKFDGSLQVRAMDGYCYTNNYAIFGRALISRPDLLMEVEQHGGASRLATTGVLRLKRIDKILSITNKHPCSTVALERAVKEWAGKGGLRMWLNDVKERLKHPPDLEGMDVTWARLEIEAFNDLIDGLSPK